MTGETSEHILPILYGTGSNGKSVFLETLMEVIGGDYSMKAPSDLLLAKSNETHPTDRADLRGRRLVACAETDVGRRLAEALVKEATGGDTIRARKMRQDFFQFKPTHKLLLATNHKPRVRGTDHAIWRRLALIPFRVTFWNPDDALRDGESHDPALRADKSLKMKLLAKRSGILSWAVAGCLAWQRDGLKRPVAVTEASREYRDAEDLIGQFLAEHVELDRMFKVKASALYQMYAGWAETIGERTASLTAFGTAMSERGLGKQKQRDGVFYLGCRLLNHDPL